MFKQSKEIFSIRKFKDGRSDSVKIGAMGLIAGTALTLAMGATTAEAKVTKNSDGTTTVTNYKGSVTLVNDDRTETEVGTDTVTRRDQVVTYKYVTEDGKVLEELKDQETNIKTTIKTDYTVYGPAGKVYKTPTATDDKTFDKEAKSKPTITKDNIDYERVGKTIVSKTGEGGGKYSSTTLGDVTAPLTPETLNSEGAIQYDKVKDGARSWIVEETGKNTYGKYVLANSTDIKGDSTIATAFRNGEDDAKIFNAANVKAEGGIKPGDYVFVLEKTTTVTSSEQIEETTQPILKAADLPSTVDRYSDEYELPKQLYAYITAHKDSTSAENEGLKKIISDYYASLTNGKETLPDTYENFKIFAGRSGTYLYGITYSNGLLDNKLYENGRPINDIWYDTEYFRLRLDDPEIWSFNVIKHIEKYAYNDHYTPLRAYHYDDGGTTVTYTYREVKPITSEETTTTTGSVKVQYLDQSGNPIKDQYLDTPETVVSTTTTTFYLDKNGAKQVLKTETTPSDVTYNAAENENEKPSTISFKGTVYHLIKSSENEKGKLVEGETLVTYTYAPTEPNKPVEPNKQQELPNTGMANQTELGALGLLGILGSIGLVKRKKKE